MRKKTFAKKEKNSPRKLRQHPLGNWVILSCSGKKTLYMYQNILSHITFFYTLFKGYKCNKLYEITPKKRFLGSPRKQISNFTGIEKTQVKSSCIRFFRLHSYCKGEGKDFLTDEGGVAKFFFSTY